MIHKRAIFPMLFWIVLFYRTTTVSDQLNLITPPQQDINNWNVSPSKMWKSCCFFFASWCSITFIVAQSPEMASFSAFFSFVICYAIFELRIETSLLSPFIHQKESLLDYVCIKIYENFTIEWAHPFLIFISIMGSNLPHAIFFSFFKL